MSLEPTCDPSVRIEAKSENYVRYRNSAGRRWEVWGVCNLCGVCWGGAGGTAPDKDCPVTPELKGCDQLTFTELVPVPREVF